VRSKAASKSVTPRVRTKMVSRFMGRMRQAKAISHEEVVAFVAVSTFATDTSGAISGYLCADR
jgi:hypothetical protein